MADPDYELLNVDSVADYVARRSALSERLSTVDAVREVGDGNLNLVFIVEGTAPDGARASLVVKQALPYVRADPSWPMSPARNLFEARALRVHAHLSPDAVPVLYDTDPDRYVFAVEDLSDHRVWRTALNDGARHDGGRSCARAVRGRRRLRHLGVRRRCRTAQIADRRGVNPPLCRITELLVFSEPYNAPGRATVAMASRADVAAYADDPDVIAAIGAAKWNFMTHAEALIHGDLHTGSVMVRDDSSPGGASTKAFDSEFAFYGPVGFDLGLLWANLCSPWRGRRRSTGPRMSRGVSRNRWRRGTRSRRRCAGTGPHGRSAVFTDRFLDAYLERLRADALDATAAEAARRVIGPYRFGPRDPRRRAAPGRRPIGARRRRLPVARPWSADRTGRHRVRPGRRPAGATRDPVGPHAERSVQPSSQSSASVRHRACSSVGAPHVHPWPATTPREPRRRGRERSGHPTRPCPGCWRSRAHAPRRRAPAIERLEHLDVPHHDTLRPAVGGLDGVHRVHVDH